MDEPSPLSERLSALPERLLIAFRPRRFRRAVTTAAKVLGVSAVFVVATVGGVLLHLNTEPGRGVTRSIVNSALQPVFQGRIEVGHIDDLSLTHARVKEAKVYDPNGEVIIHAHGIDASIETFALLEALLTGEGPVHVRLPHTRIREAVVTLRPDDSGVPSIAEAFIPRPTGPSTPSKRATIVDLQSIEIADALVEGNVGAPIEADVRALKGSVFVRDDRVVAVDVTDARVLLRELVPSELDAGVTYHLRVDLRKEPERREELPEGAVLEDPMMMWATVDGEIGDVPTTATGTMQGLYLDTRAVFPDVQPDALKAVFPWVPIEAPATARGRLSGMLPSPLRIEGSVEIDAEDGVAAVALDGGLGVEQDGIRVALGLAADNLDPRALLVDAPAARVDASAKITITLPKGTDEPRIMAEVATAPTTLFEQSIPPVDAVVHVHEGEVIGSVTIHEAGAPVEAQVTLSDGVVAFSAEVNADELSDVPRLDKMLQGALRARVKGTFEDGQLHATASANARGIGTAGSAESSVRADSVTVLAEIEGPVDDLSIDARASATGVTTLDEKLDSVRIGAAGPITSPNVTLRVDDGERGVIQASAGISIVDRKASAISFSIEREGETAKGEIASVEFGDRFSIDGLQVREGTIGGIAGSLRIEKDEIIGDLKAQGLDLGRVQRLLALPISMGGVANVDVHVERSARGRKGAIEIEVERARFLLIEGVSARLSARFDGDKVEASGYVRIADEATDEERLAAREAQLASTEPAKREEDETAPPASGEGQPAPEVLLCDGPIAEVRFANLSGKLDGPLLSAQTWKNATGAVDVAADNWNLGCIERRIPSFLWPFAKARGLVTARARVERSAGSRYPSVTDLRVATVGLDLTGDDGKWASKQLDVAAVARFDGSSGAAAMTIAAYEQKTRAILLQGDLDTTIDIAAFAAGGEASEKAVRTAPFNIVVAMPAREVSTLGVLPSPLAELIPQMAGTVEGRVKVTGSLELPTVTARMLATGIMPASGGEDGAWVPALDVDIAANYDPTAGRGNAVAKVTLPGEEPVTTVTADLILPASAILDRPKDGKVPWEASVRADVQALPLESLPLLAERGVEGDLTGEILFNRINAAPEIRVTLATNGLLVQGRPFSLKVAGGTFAQADESGRNAYFEVNAVGDQKTVLREEKQADGSMATVPTIEENALSVIGRGHVTFEGGVVPTLDMSKSGELVVGARDFQIVPFYPFVASTLSKLEGKLDGDATVAWNNLLDPLQGSIKEAKLELSDVVAYIPELGQELRDGKATISASPAADGRQEISVTGIEAYGSTGRAAGALSVTLAGLEFSRADGFIEIKENEDLPITVEGVSLGKAHGRVDVRSFEKRTFEETVLRDGAYTTKNTTVYTGDIRVSNAKFELPESSGKNVQALDDARGVKVSELLGPPIEKRSADAPYFDLSILVEETVITSSILKIKVKSVAAPRFDPSTEGKPQDLGFELQPAPIRVMIGDRLRASGDIAVVEGSVVVNKKKFEIERGLVRLREEETGNPYVNLTAVWTGTTETRVYVDYAGLLSPITEDKIRFRSDPPLSQDEIVQMLLFGTGAANATNLVGTVGGSVATGFANSLLSTATGGFFEKLTLSIGASENESSLGASYAANEQFSVGGSVRQVQESRGTANTTETGQCGDLYFEWRLSERWSLRGASGVCGYQDQGPAEDGDAYGITVGIDALFQDHF